MSRRFYPLFEAVAEAPNLSTEEAGEAIVDAVMDLQIENVLTFKDAGVLTANDGLVVTLADGTEYQITIVQSR